MKKIQPLLIQIIAVLGLVLGLLYLGYRVGSRKAVIATEDLKRLLIAQQTALEKNSQAQLFINEVQIDLQKAIADIEKRQETLINIELKRLQNLKEQNSKIENIRDSLFNVNQGLKRLQDIGKLLPY